MSPPSVLISSGGGWTGGWVVAGGSPAGGGVTAGGVVAGGAVALADGESLVPGVVGVVGALRRPPAAPAAAGTARLTQQQAIDIAMARAPGASLDRVRMEPEHGALVWKVDLFAGGTEYEFRIDASTGAVVRAEVDGDGGSGHGGDDGDHEDDGDHDDDGDDGDDD